MPPNKSPEDIKRSHGLRLAYNGTLYMQPDVISSTLTKDPVLDRTTVTLQLEANPDYNPGPAYWEAAPYVTNATPAVWAPMDPTTCIYYTTDWKWIYRMTNASRVISNVWDPLTNSWKVTIDGQHEKLLLLQKANPIDLKDTPISCPITAPAP